MGATASQEETVEASICIRPYDPQWPALYESERAVLAGAIGEWVTGGIHHVGSTAIPGVDAEPVIDILVGIDDISVSRSCIGPLAQLDYLAEPSQNGEMHEFFKPKPDRRMYDLSLLPVRSARYSQMLAFRDLLRADRQVAIGYAGMKRDLANRHGRDRRRYTAAKAELVETVLARLA